MKFLLYVCTYITHTQCCPPSLLPGVAKLLLQRGANINTHSAEFKESALTLACYKGHLEMVRFLLGAGADQEHKTDEMHTALMEASMVGGAEGGACGGGNAGWGSVHF